MADSEEITCTMVSCGASHTVALLSDQSVVSWGRAEDGQLGHGDAREKHVPYVIGALDSANISSISCGADHTITYSEKDKTMYSWGWGDFGRLGHGNSTDLFNPMPVHALGGVQIRNIACGDCHCIAVTGDGEAYSWGRNQNGQLGLGNTEDGLLPQKIEAFKGIRVSMVSAGAEHSAATTEDGRLYGWGWGRYGNLGLGDKSDRHVPEVVKAVQDEQMTLVACGWRHTIAVSRSGSLFSVGWSKYGQLGHGNFDDLLVPKAVEALRGKTVAQIAGGWRHTVALMSDGVLYSWGWNKFGQVGIGNLEDQCLPQEVKDIGEEVVFASCGWRHTVAITKGGNVFSWGRGTSGQLGQGDSVDRSLPKRIDALSRMGKGCRHLPRSERPVRPAALSLAPSERYAVVPAGHGEAPDDASVPQQKRVRTI